MHLLHEPLAPGQYQPGARTPQGLADQEDVAGLELVEGHLALHDQ